EFGADRGYPVGELRSFMETPFRVGSFSNLDRIMSAQVVPRAATTSPLPRAATEPAISYAFAGKRRDLDDYLAGHEATGLLIAQGDTILVERYQYARNDSQRLTSWSMAKSINAMLFGIAVGEGRIRSLDERAQDYLPELAGSAYGATSLRHLLTMSSGV